VYDEAADEALGSMWAALITVTLDAMLAETDQVAAWL
jgi:hypothetical protein